MFYIISLYASLAILIAGLIYKISNWFRYPMAGNLEKLPPSRRVAAAARGFVRTLASAKILVLMKILFLKVLWQQELLKKDFFRWFAHMCMFGGFILLLLMHGLDKLIAPVLFSDYYPTLYPFIFLRNLFGLIVFLGIGLVVYRRCFSATRRPKSTAIDFYAIFILAFIMISGFLLEATKISSYSLYETMVSDYASLSEEDTEEQQALGAFWVQKYGVVSPNLKGPFEKDVLQQGEEIHQDYCAECHSRPQWAFLSYGASRLMGPAAVALDRAAVHRLLWYLHVLVCFAGLAYLPFSKFFHIVASPLYLFVRGVIEEGRSDPANVATMQAMALDACTHCGDCTQSCSVAVAYHEIPNPGILPSEKLAAYRKLLSGRRLDKKHLIKIQEGSHICTDCHRCTDVCPMGIDLEQMWSNLKRHVAEFGYSKPEAWAKQTIGTGFIPQRYLAESFSLLPPDGEFIKDLKGTHQANTFTLCFECQNCTNICPVVGEYESPRKELGLLPHEIMHCLALKQKELVLGSRMLWECLTCYLCQEQCPQGVCITDVLYELKNLALNQLKQEA